MNHWDGIGRLTRDPDVRTTQGGTKIARFTLAVDRKYKREGEATTDFIDCIVFGKPADFTEKYFRKGMRVAVGGRIQIGSYTNRDGQKVKTFDIVVEDQEFCESRQTAQAPAQSPPPVSERVAQAERAMEAKRNRDEALDGFMDLPDTIDDEDLPFT